MLDRRAKMTTLIKAFVVVSLVVVAFPAAHVLACKCVDQPFGWNVLDASVVVRATVVAVGPHHFAESKPLDQLTEPERKAVLADRLRGTRDVLVHVTAIWKGNVGRTMTLRTGEGFGDCGVPFLVGYEYLILSAGSSGQDLSTSICNGTDLVAKRQKELRKLGRPRKPQ
jgi:hypothetical protein